MRGTTFILIFAALLLGAWGAPAHAGDLYIACSAGVTLTLADVRDVFLGEKQFAGPVKLQPVDNNAGQFKDLCNLEMVELERPDKPDDIATIRRMLENHFNYTASTVAGAILNDFENEIKWFVKVMPTDYRRVLEHKAESEERARQLSQRQA